MFYIDKLRNRSYEFQSYFRRCFEKMSYLGDFIS